MKFSVLYKVPAYRSVHLNNTSQASLEGLSICTCMFTAASPFYLCAIIGSCSRPHGALYNINGLKHTYETCVMSGFVLASHSIRCQLPYIYSCTSLFSCTSSFPVSCRGLFSVVVHLQCAAYANCLTPACAVRIDTEVQ